MAEEQVALVRPEIANFWVLHHHNVLNHALLMSGREFLAKQAVARTSLQPELGRG